MLRMMGVLLDHGEKTYREYSEIIDEKKGITFI